MVYCKVGETKIYGVSKRKGPSQPTGELRNSTKGSLDSTTFLPRMQSETFTDIKVDLKSFSERNTEIAKRKSIFA